VFGRKTSLFISLLNACLTAAGLGRRFSAQDAPFVVKVVLPHDPKTPLELPVGVPLSEKN